MIMVSKRYSLCIKFLVSSDDTSDMLCLDDSRSESGRGLSVFSSFFEKMRATQQLRTERREREEYEQMVERVSELKWLLKKAHGENAVLRRTYDQATKNAEARMRNVTKRVTAAEKQLRLALEAAVAPPPQKTISPENRISSDPELSTSYTYSTDTYMSLLRGKPILTPVLTLEYTKKSSTSNWAKYFSETKT